MSPEITDYFGKASIDTDYAIATTVKTTRTAGATVLEAYDLSKFSDTTPVFVVTYKKETDPITGDVSVVDLRSFKALVNTGANTLTNLTIAPGYVDDLGNDEGDFIECIPTSYWENSFVDGIFIAHLPNGKLKAAAPIDGGYDLSALVNGWILADETWEYSNWTAATRIAEITVATDATTRFQVGDRVKFTQPTDGVKYGIVHKVEATLLHVFLASGTDFDNEDITAPYYSRVKAPFGFSLNPTTWSVEATDTTERDLSNNTNVQAIHSSTNNTIGVGLWDLYFSGSAHVERDSGSGSGVSIAISTANNSFSHNRLRLSSGVVPDWAPIPYASWAQGSAGLVREVTTGTETWYGVCQATGGTPTDVKVHNDLQTFVNRATSAYL